MTEMEKLIYAAAFATAFDREAKKWESGNSLVEPLKVDEYYLSEFAEAAVIRYRAATKNEDCQSFEVKPWEEEFNQKVEQLFNRYGYDVYPIDKDIIEFYHETLEEIVEDDLKDCSKEEQITCLDCARSVDNSGVCYGSNICGDFTRLLSY